MLENITLDDLSVSIEQTASPNSLKQISVNCNFKVSEDFSNSESLFLNVIEFVNKDSEYFFGIGRELVSFNTDKYLEDDDKLLGVKYNLNIEYTSWVNINE